MSLGQLLPRLKRRRMISIHIRITEGMLPTPSDSAYIIYSTTLAVAGSEFAVAIADDRVSKGYSICTRKGCKITKLYVRLCLNI